MADPIDNIKDLAEYAYKFFVQRLRGEGEDTRFWTLADRFPTWLDKMTKKVHDDGQWFPDDYKYQYIVDALNNLSEGWDPEEGGFDLEPDIYNSDLLKWLGSHNARTSFVDDAVSEYGWEDERGIIGAIQLGQQAEKREVWNHVVEALNDRLSDIEDGVAEVFERRGKGPEGVKEWRPEN